MAEVPSFEPTVLQATWRYRWLVLLIVGVVATFAFIFSSITPSRYAAEATLLVEDPRTSALFETGVIARPERYVSNQATILTSAALADRAVALAAEEGVAIRTSDVVDDLEVTFSEDSDEIMLRFVDDDADTAILVVNSLATAYEEVRVNTASSDFNRAIEELDSSILNLESRLESLDAEIDALSSTEALTALEEQYQTALQRLVELQSRLPAATGEELESLRAALDDVLQQIQTHESLLRLEQTSPDVAPLLTEREQLATRISELDSRRDRLVVDASLSPTGIVLFSPAIEAEETQISPIQLVVVAIVIGGIIGTAIAYFLAVRNRLFTERTQPENVLQTPLLAAVPDFREENVKEIPVMQAPTSSAAESFRFAAAALQRATVTSDGAMYGESEPPRSFVIVSAATGDGKSVLIANLALAASLQQMRVLAIDADFGDQGLTRMLNNVDSMGPGDRPLGPGSPGLTDLIEQGVSLRNAVTRVEISGFPGFDLLSRGVSQVTAPEFFGKSSVRRFFRDVRDEYDIVLIDAPPMLQVAYASSLAHFGDRAVIVIPHRSSVGRAEELVDHLGLTDTIPLGYVYTKAPLRADLPMTEGSMSDILGRGVSSAR